MSETPSTAEFQRAFAHKARAVKLRRLASYALAGTLLGLGAGVLGALAFWRLGFAAERLACGALGVLGAVGGALVGARRRWSDTELALYLDARLKSDETLTTAVSALGASRHGEPALAHVLERGNAVLRAHGATKVGPRVLGHTHWLLPLCALGIVLVSRLPVPPRQAKGKLPGSDALKIQNLPGLERIEALAKLPGRTPEQEARLRAIAEQAKKLREALAQGLERREALSELGKMRDEISAERLKLGDPQNRAGLDAAQNAFGKKPALHDAQRALGNGDLTQFDDEMKRLANRAESSDREAAKEALEQAEKAAREKGAQGLADALKDQQKLFEERESQAQALRELAEAMRDKLPQDALDELKDFGATGDPEAQRKLAEAMEKALEGLTAEERQRLAERLSKQLESSGGGGKPMSKRELESLAKKLASKDGADALRDELRELAKQEPSDDARREHGLGDADRGDSEAQRGLGAMPMPMPGDGSGNNPGKDGAPGKGPGNDAQGKGKGSGDGSGGPGSHHDTGTGDHARSTPEVNGKELRAKAQATLQGSGPMHGATLGRAPARPGETANELGTGSLGSVGQAEVGAVDHADIPEEYREQVGRYFEP